MKVLQVIEGNSFGGISKLVLEFSNNIKDIDFEYLSNKKMFDINNAYYFDNDRKSLFKKIIYNYKLYKLLKKNKYDIVHINVSTFFFSMQVAFVSKIAGVKKVIAHSHNNPNISKIKKLIISLFRPLYNKLIDVKLACSFDAAKSLFNTTNNVTIINNGINIDDFKFNEKIREEYRKKLNIENKRVYGFTGRLASQKNPEFLIDIFYELQKKSNSILLIIGSGKLEEKIKDKVKKLKIEDKVIFLGFRKDINKLLNCMDIFLFPSLFEGLGISLIEAQTNGLPCFVSKFVPDDAKISSNFYKINSFDINDWINKINSININNREDKYLDTIKNGYDIKDTSKKLEKIYKDLIK